jgi:hypothetical protein
VLSKHAATHASVATTGGDVYAAWTEKDGAYSRVRIARLKSEGQVAHVVYVVAPETAALRDDQLYPSIAPGANGELVVAWEDRRFGHTSIVYAFSADGKKFTAPRDVNEAFRRSPRNLGRGSGAMRVALARISDQRLIAVWLDKRDFLSGYDIYAAFSDDGGRTFGKNLKVQDSFGDNIAQWHPAVAARDDRIVVVWDDDRDGTSDLWVSWWNGTAWSDDLAPRGAQGPGVQADPVIALDADGHVHLAWTEKLAAGAGTRLRYLRGTRRPSTTK